MKLPLLLTGMSLVAATPLLAQAMDMPGAHDAKSLLSRSDVEATVKTRFTLFDTDKDGVVTRAEMAAGRDAEMKSMQNHMFEMIDTNKDGAISRAEFDAHHTGMKMPMGHGDHVSSSPSGDRAASPHRPLPPMPPMAMMRNSEAMFAMADTNKDGTITEAEAVATALAHFDRRDANKDGVLTAEERRAAWKRRKDR